MKKFRPILLFLLVLFISGCAHVVSKNFREQADGALTFQQVFQGPNNYKGKLVVWGGEIIQTENQKDGATLIEVFQRPLGWRGEPKATVASEGRFLALVDKYLDPYVFRRGRRITIGGEILGERIRPIGQMDYRYPFLLCKEINLWEDYDPYYYPYYYHAPWWWAYPYWWRFNFYYHRHHPR